LSVCAAFFLRCAVPGANFRNEKDQQMGKVITGTGTKTTAKSDGFKDIFGLEGKIFYSYDDILPFFFP
jgi:hypothetical protein